MEVILIFILLAFASAWLAKKAKRNPYIWFIIGLVFGPIGLLIFFFPKREKNKTQDRKISVLNKIKTHLQNSNLKEKLYDSIKQQQKKKKEDKIGFSINIHTTNTVTDYSEDDPIINYNQIIKKLKDLPKNRLFKKLINGEEILSKTNDNRRNNGVWYIPFLFNISDGRAIGYLLSRYKDEFVLQSVFDVKINKNGGFKVSDILYNISEFTQSESIKVEYLANYNDEFYDINNVEIVLT